MKRRARARVLAAVDAPWRAPQRTVGNGRRAPRYALGKNRSAGVQAVRKGSRRRRLPEISPGPDSVPPLSLGADL